MVDVPTPPLTASWRKSGMSHGDGECVQVAPEPGHVWVRDSKDPQGPALRFTREGWMVFLAGIQGGDFDHREVSV